MKKMFKRISILIMGKPKARVLLIRHGHTDLNKSSGQSIDRIRGWVDVPLNDEGRRDAEKAKENLLKTVPKVDQIYSSDLSRATETAEIINKAYHAQIIASPALRPWNLGVYQGKATKDVMGDLNHMIEHDTEVPKDGEAFRTFRTRYLTLMKKIIEQAKQKDEVILVTTHYRNVKLVEAWVTNGMPDDFSIDDKVMEKNDKDPGDIMEVPI